MEKRILVTDLVREIEELSKKIVNPKLYSFEGKRYKFDYNEDWVVEPNLAVLKIRDHLEKVETTVKEIKTGRILIVTQRYVGIGFITEKIEEVVKDGE